jgi:branched-subunit amino acid aminotransferase/4-amino-4-deoxychorismate lyase
MTLSLPRGTRLPDRAVWVNGRIVRGDEAAVSVFDRGARDGGGLFETLRVYGGKPFAWERHMERLVLSAAELGFPVPPSPRRLREAVAEVLEACALADAVVRITVTRGVAGGRPVRTGAWVEAEPIGGRLWPGARQVDPDDGGPLGGRAVLSQTPFTPGFLGRHKTTSRLAWDLAREEARAAGADEILLLSSEGEVLEGGASNVFVVRSGGDVVTPPLGADIRPGVTRAVVLELCRPLGIIVHEAPIPLEMLRWAAEVFVTNSVQEVLPLREVAGRRTPEREVTLRILQCYRECVAASE